jgi:hypothetical protein
MEAEDPANGCLDYRRMFDVDSVQPIRQCLHVGFALQEDGERFEAG